jgi:hypothetical protein
METFKQYFTEHCKTGEYFGPFNVLQKDILRTLYFDHLKDRVERFDGEHITDDSSLIMTYIDMLPGIFPILGDKLCKHIPDEKTIDHTEGDVKKWADALFRVIKIKKVVDNL